MKPREKYKPLTVRYVVDMMVETSRHHQTQFDQMHQQVVRLINERNHWKNRAQKAEAKLK